MKLFRVKYLQMHGSIQKKYNLMIQTLMNYMISNIANFHQELKCEVMNNQVGLSIQDSNINLHFKNCSLRKNLLFSMDSLLFLIKIVNDLNGA